MIGSAGDIFSRRSEPIACLSFLAALEPWFSSVMGTVGTEMETWWAEVGGRRMNELVFTWRKNHFF
jgi:hypothetical protein